MKKLIFFSTFLIFSVSLFAQDMSVPKVVKEAFANQYPKIVDVKWDKEGDEEYEAEFTNNGVKTSVVIDEDGEIEEIEIAIKTNDLSSNIMKYVKENYSSYEITEAAKITDEDGNVFYEAEISKGESKTDLLFDSNGNPVKKQKEAEEYDEEDED